MKVRTILVATLATLTLAACSKDDGTPVDTGGTGTPGESTYAMFTISLTNSNSRAFHGSLVPTADEGKVDQLTVYIYDLYTNKVEVVETFADENDSKSVEITTGPKKIFATSGIAPAFTLGETNIDLAKELDVADEAYFKGTVTQAQKFWMTSDVVEKTIVSATKAEAETAGHNNNITLRLGRAMAKIGVYYNETLVGDIKDGAVVLGELQDVEYKVKNNPNKMYLFTEENAAGVWITPYYNRNNNLWDPSHKADYWSQAAYSATTIDGSNNHTAPTYMMENSNITARNGNATYLAIAAKFVPAAALLKDATSGTPGATPNPAGTFYRAAKVVFEIDGVTVKEILSWTNDFYNGDPTGSPGVLAADEAAYEYTNGLCYYTLYLDRSLDTSKPMGNTADKYSQRRNQYWDVEITSVTAVGWPEEDGGRGPDPEPLDKEAWLHANIQIMNWTGVYMPGELEGAE